MTARIGSVEQELMADVVERALLGGPLYVLAQKFTVRDEQEIMNAVYTPGGSKKRNAERMIMLALKRVCERHGITGAAFDQLLKQMNEECQKGTTLMEYVTEVQTAARR